MKTSSTPKAPATVRLAPEISPRHYTLRLDVDPRRPRFQGSVEVVLEAPVGTRTIELHSVDLDLREIAVLDDRGPLPLRRTRIDAKRQVVRLELRHGLRSHEARVRITYEGPLRDDLRGLYAARSGSRRYASTQLEAADARRFFPCFDEPDKKARFQLSVTIPGGLRAVSNAPVARRERSEGRETLHFAPTPPLSTYLIALVVGELECSRARQAGRQGTPIRVWAVPGRKRQMAFALEAAAASLERLERYFGLPYPYEKLDLIAVPDFEFGAMENAGAVTFRESLLLVDPKTISLPERKRVAEVIAHELAHMWFGDLVTMAWWDDLWLNEAFATWMAFSVIDDWRPEWKLWLDFQQSRSSAFGLDALENTHPIYTDVSSPAEATQNFDLITYEKGASVVRMVERWLGASVFRRGVRAYIRKHREGNARAADLWGALEQASGRSVGPVVWSWISRPGFPLLEARRTPKGIAVEQRRYFASASRMARELDEPWPIPAVLGWRGARGKRRATSELIRRRRQTIALGDGTLRFVYANADEAGFYRALHSQDLLDDLRQHWTELSGVERMGLLQHQWAGVRADRAPLASLLDLFAALRDEPEPEVLRAAYGPLAWLHDQVIDELPASLRMRFATWIRACFGPSFEELGFAGPAREADEHRSRRAALLQILGEIGRDPAVLAEIDARIDPYLRDRASLDANLATPVVRLAARGGSKARYDRYLRAVREAKTPQDRTRFELALGDFTDAALVQRTLGLLLDPLIPTQDVVILIVRLLENPSAREATWTFVQRRWDALSPRVPTGLASRLVGALPALKTRAHRQEVARFFRAHPMPSAARALRQALERFDLDARLRKRVRPQLAAWLRARDDEDTP